MTPVPTPATLRSSSDIAPPDIAPTRRKRREWPEGDISQRVIKRVPPADDGKQQHAIRSTLEQHDRVAKESELMRGLKAQLPDLRCVHFPQTVKGTNDLVRRSCL